MTFFSELFELTRDATVALIVSGDHASGQMTISVVPKPRDSHKEDGLCRDLTLAGTPAEFEEQFLHALREYRCARTSLAEQARTTLRVLEAATKASAATANAKGRVKREASQPEQVNRAKEPGQGDPAKTAAGEHAGVPCTDEPVLQAELFE